MIPSRIRVGAILIRNDSTEDQEYEMVISVNKHRNEATLASSGRLDIAYIARNFRVSAKSNGPPFPNKEDKLLGVGI